MTIGERIKQRREELGLSVEEVAKLLGKHRATIYRYESNEIEKFPTDTLGPIAKVLHTTPACLMGWESSAPANIIPVPTPTTSPMLRSLCDAFDRLSDEGREKLVDYADDLVSSGKYKKHGADEVGRKEA